MGIEGTNTFQLKFLFNENCVLHWFGRLMGVGVGVDVAFSRSKLRNLKSQFTVFDSFRDIGVHIYDFFKFVGVCGR